MINSRNLIYTNILDLTSMLTFLFRPSMGNINQSLTYFATF